MDTNSREGMPSNGTEQTSFGSQLNPGFETGTGGSATSSVNSGPAEFDVTPAEGGFSGKARSVASTVKGKAAGIPAMIADGLQAGAEALRQRRASASTTGPGSSVTIADDPTIAAVTDTLASGMQSSADWLRDADLDKIKDGVEKQVKEHPARTLLVALGAGYLLGKVFRR